MATTADSARSLQPLRLRDFRCPRLASPQRCRAFLPAPPKKSRGLIAPHIRASASPSTTTTTSDRAAFGSEYFAGDKQPIILFDGVCNLCNGGVNFMLDWDVSGSCRFAALQSPAGRALLRRSGRAPDDISSIVLVEEGASHVRSEAILRIARLLGAPFPALAALGLLVPLPLRDGVYGAVADNRYSFFGRAAACRLSDARFAARFVQ